jgi:surfeit locus 1 family protein
MSEQDDQQLRFKFDWRASALVMMLMPILLTLGFWQLDRAEEKRQLQSVFEQRVAAGPVMLSELDWQSDLRYQAVRLSGEYVNENAILLDNRIYQGRFGYEIITPFKLAGSDTGVLINRGWIAGDRSRRTLPDIPAVHGEWELIGQIYMPQRELMQLADHQQQGWPRVVQVLDVTAIAEELKQTLFPYSVRLSAGSSGLLQANWQVVNQQPEKHVGYAVQWFAMAFTLVIIAFLSNTNCWAWLKTPKPSKDKEV